MLRFILLALALVAIAQCAEYKAAVLTQTNAVSTIGNEIVLFLHDENDRLTLAGRFPTWDFLGNGNVTAGSGPGAPMVANPIEPLGSQGSVVVRNNRVYAVNAGSNDWSVLPITNGDGLGFATTTPSMGFFPNTIDACGELVVVGNAGNGGILAGFRLKEDGTYENTFTSPLESNTGNPASPGFGIGQVTFIRDCTQAIVTLKDASANLTLAPITSRIWVYEFDDEFNIKNIGKTTFPGDDLIFSFTVDVPEVQDEGTERVFMYTTNPVTMSSSSFEINADLTATLIDTVPNGGQGGACWNQNYRNWMFSGNFGSQSISRFNFSDEGDLYLQDSQAAVPGSPVLDMAGWSNFLYVLLPELGVVRIYVVDRETGALTGAGEGIGLDYRLRTDIPATGFTSGATGAVGLFAVGLQPVTAASPASFLAPSFLFVLALLKALF